MNNEKQKKFKVIHLLLGLFFVISGISILFDARYVFSSWIISLGLFFLFDSYKESLKSKINSSSLELIHYILAGIVLITGITVMLTELEII